jgi:signal transduction histidine kinase
MPFRDVSRDEAGRGLPDLERSIARCRVLLSVVAILAVYVDPTLPTLTRWLPLTGGPFMMSAYTFAVMLAHLAYSVGLYAALGGELVSKPRLVAFATWGDVIFGALIALVTEGTTSPFYAFFAFAVVAVGLRAGLRATLAVTAVSALLYMSLIVVSAPENVNVYIMRPAYLAITGYLVGYLGQRRLDLERQLRALENSAQREHIARSLHDGYAQALAGVNLRLESCRELIRRGRTGDAFTELTDLQASVNREHDELRAYIRSLIDLEASPGLPPSERTRFEIAATFDGSQRLVEHVLGILLEGARNVGRHAQATRACLVAGVAEGKLRITIEDDGVGFSSDAGIPWAIASRVAELDGSISVVRTGPSGAHVVVDLPAA